MNKLGYIIAYLLSTLPVEANAEEESVNWFCKEESSKRVDDTILSCGIGIGNDENEARLNAFENAKKEFAHVCSSSNDCNQANVYVEPKRTSCEIVGGQTKCYRLVAFTQQDMSQKLGHMTSSIGNSKKYSPIKKNMSKKELVSTLGMPYTVSKDFSNRLQAFYKGDVCIYSWDVCYVILEDNVVTNWEGIKPQYTEDFN